MSLLRRQPSTQDVMNASHIQRECIFLCFSCLCFFPRRLHKPHVLRVNLYIDAKRREQCTLQLPKTERVSVAVDAKLCGHDLCRHVSNVG